MAIALLAKERSNDDVALSIYTEQNPGEADPTSENTNLPTPTRPRSISDLLIKDSLSLIYEMQHLKTTSWMFQSHFIIVQSNLKLNHTHRKKKI